MIFSELALTDMFKVEEFPDIVFTKVVEHDGNCCTGPHNATYHEGTPSKKNKKVMLFQQDKEIVPYFSEVVTMPDSNQHIRQNNIQLEPKTGP